MASSLNSHAEESCCGISIGIKPASETDEFNVIWLLSVVNSDLYGIGEKRPRLSREDWLQVTLKVLQYRGVGGVKIVVIAERLGVTSGSFYWQFKNLRNCPGWRFV